MSEQSEGIQEIATAAISSIVLCKENQPRHKATKTGLQELVDSIKAVGIIQPLAVRREGDRLELVSGHRRLEAARRAGLSAVPVHVLEIDQEEAERVALIENVVREDLDPIDQGVAFSALIKGGRTPKDLAEETGLSASFIARRANLANLSPAWRMELLRKGSASRTLSPELLVKLALLGPEAQDDLLHDFGPGVTEANLADALRFKERDLGKAPWDPADEELLPKTGACTACSMNSAHSPGLFEEDERASELGHCREQGCWSSKLQAWRDRRLAEERLCHPNLVTIAGGHVPGQGLAATVDLKHWEYSRAKKRDKGAVPAFVTLGRGLGKVVWIKPKSLKEGGLSCTRAVKKAERARVEKLKESDPKAWARARLKETVERLERRRCSALVSAVARRLKPGAIVQALGSANGCARIAGTAECASPEEAACRLIAAFGFQGCGALSSSQHVGGKGKPRDLLLDLERGMLPRIRSCVAAGTSDQVSLARWIAERIFGPEELEAMELKVVDEIPEPRVAENLRAVIRGRAPAKKKAVARVKKKGTKPGTVKKRRSAKKKASRTKVRGKS